MSSSLVSIIIPVFNRATLLGETLISIQKQTYTNWECIVVDDGSTDSTQEVIQLFVENDNRIKFYNRPTETEKGANSCRNYGFERSLGEFINWFDSDDVMLSDCIEKKIEAFSPTLDFVIAAGYYWNPIDTTKSILKLEPTENLFVDFVQWKIEIITNSVLFRKAFLLNKPMFNAQMKRGQEAEYFARLFFGCQPNQYQIIPHFGFLYRQHDGTKSSRNTVYNAGYKESLLYFLSENFTRSEQIQSAALLDFFYGKLVKLLFTSNGNQHDEVTKAIINDFFPKLKKYSYLKAIELILFSKLMLLFKKSPYVARNRWLNFKFDWNG
jgi:glycosyltransferase involved in cell wall biosynthesis